MLFAINTGTSSTLVQNDVWDGYVGESAVCGPITLGDGGIIITPNIFGVANNGIRGFTLGYTTLEPNALALAGLGGLLLGAWRRWQH